MIEKLKTVLAQEDTVLFIGSGVSIWSGLPTWSGLIDELAAFIEEEGLNAQLVKQEAIRGDLLQAASYGFDKLTNQQIGKFIRNACQYGIAEPHEIHKKIVSLGPRCYITTNYDNLLEQSLHKWQSDRFYRPPITNRHLTETADIVHARATDYIFKPHGDAADIESIVLTREQYRELLPQGGKYSALETLKMIMTTRPVVYIGFGLRDLDFLYIRDLLANTYNGGTRDHYAIMSDISEAESDYWRKNYGIHLISYPTIEDANGRKNHSQLLTLLDSLNNKGSQKTTVKFNPQSSNTILALARYASGLARMPKLPFEFEIRVHSETRKGKNHYRVDKFENTTANEFLTTGPTQALLIGLPGAGKTYSLRKAVATIATKVNEACLMERFGNVEITVPVLVDLKLYNGNLEKLIRDTLPPDLPFIELIQHFKVKIFLDSFNEMPREYWENGVYESDFEKLIKDIGDASLIIGSRTSDGLSKIDFPIYCLDQISKETVIDELKRLGSNVEGRFAAEIYSLLQRPFYFQYIISKRVILPKEAHPREFYKLFFVDIRKAFNERFKIDFDIELALSFAAYETLNRGEEALPLMELLRVLGSNLISANIAQITSQDIANWLVSYSVMIPYTGNRIAFVHQSITEYLAATELARQYVKNSYILREKLSLTRWDQALFLTLSLLPKTKADAFLQDVIKVDFALALNASKYLEVNRDKTVTKLLSEVPEYVKNNELTTWQLDHAIGYNLPVTVAHTAELSAIVELRDSLGGAAAKRLIEIAGEEVKNSFLQKLFDNPGDYNFCQAIGRALQPFATEDDLEKITQWADELDKMQSDEIDDDAALGFVAGIAFFLNELQLSILQREFVQLRKVKSISTIGSKILCHILWGKNSTEALELAGELLLNDVNEASVAINFIASDRKTNSNLSWESFNESHVHKLISLSIGDDPYWSKGTLSLICLIRPDLAALTQKIADEKSGFEKLILSYCVSPHNLEPVFKALVEFANNSEGDQKGIITNYFEGVEFDWTGKEDVFVMLLRLHNIDILNIVSSHSLPAQIKNLADIKIDEIEWWLDWIIEMMSNKDTLWLGQQLASILGQYANMDAQKAFLDELNKANTKYRQCLSRSVLVYKTNLSTDDFSQNTISFLLSMLNDEKSINKYGRNLLGMAATEQFVTEQLLPILSNANGVVLNNLRIILDEAGSRHGRRYFLG